MTDQLAFALDLIRVHCFDQRCAHVVEDTDPDRAHDAMERHYADLHAAYIRSVVLS